MRGAWHRDLDASLGLDPPIRPVLRPLATGWCQEHRVPQSPPQAWPRGPAHRTNEVWAPSITQQVGQYNLEGFGSGASCGDHHVLVGESSSRQSVRTGPRHSLG